MSTMRLRIHGSPLQHRWGRTDVDDVRLAWTRCGVRFAWGPVPRGDHRRHPCPDCNA